MSKHSTQFPRIERDFYPTPEKAVLPLLRHLTWQCTFTEPCAGNGALISHLEKHGDYFCRSASDIAPQPSAFADINQRDAFDIDRVFTDFIITNPPWQRRAKEEAGKMLPAEDQPLHRLIMHFKDLAPTWLLFDADWMHTVQAKPYLEYCVKIVSVGRVKWFEGTDHSGKTDCAWYLFDKPSFPHTLFYGRESS